MATQAIEFTGPPGQTITLDVVDPADDSLDQTALVCTERTNAKGFYVTANFTDTLAGRRRIVKKIGGAAIGNDLVDIQNADGTYKSHGAGSKRERWEVVEDTEEALTLDRN